MSHRDPNCRCALARARPSFSCMMEYKGRAEMKRCSPKHGDVHRARLSWHSDSLAPQGRAHAAAELSCLEETGGHQPPSAWTAGDVNY